MQTTIGEPGAASSIALLRQRTEDLDYLAASLHGRRSRMAEAERLDNLCRIRNLSEFFRTFYPETELKEVTQFQHLLVSELANEIYEILFSLSGPGAELLNWMLVRFHVENLKVLARQCLTKTTIDMAGKHLISLPGEFRLKIHDFAEAKSPKDIVRLIPKGHFRESLEKTLKIIDDNPRPFFFEAALDRAYYQELLAKTDGLSPVDRDIIRPMMYQEVDLFHLMLAVRGKFHYSITADMLRPFHVPGTLISCGLFAAMLSDLDLDTSVGRVAERVLDDLPFRQGSCDRPRNVDAETIESLAWRRFLRLSNIAFCKSHMGLGAVAGYVGMRRVEVANLITISEGIRSAISQEMMHVRLIPGSHGEWNHV